MSEEVVKASEAKKKRGGQKGNKNGRKHGFYSQGMKPEELESLPAAAKLDGLEQEIALMRKTILSMLAEEPRNHKLIIEATNTVNRLICTQKRLGNHDRRLFSIFKGLPNDNSRLA